MAGQLVDPQQALTSGGTVRPGKAGRAARSGQWAATVIDECVPRPRQNIALFARAGRRLGTAGQQEPQEAGVR